MLEQRGFTKEAHPVNVGLLSDGKVYKNYSALAKEMGWTIYKSDSNGQRAQFKRLSEVCRWSKDLDENGKRRSNKIIIHEVYGKKQVAIDKRKNNKNTVLTRLVARSILEVLADYNQKHPLENEDFANTQKMVITLGGLYCRIGLVNDNYLKGRHRQYELSTLLNLPVQHVNDFYACVHDSLKHTLYKALDDLHNKRLVNYRKTKRLVFKSVTLEQTDIDALHESGMIQMELITESSFADCLQDDFIFTTEREVLTSYGLSNINEIYTKDRKTRERFFQEVVQRVREKALLHRFPSIQRLSELDYYYNALELSFYSPFVEGEVNDKRLTLEEREQIQAFVDEEAMREYLTLGGANVQAEINQTHMERVKKNAENRHRKALKEEKARDRHFKRTAEDYVEHIESLTGAVIDRNTSFKMKQDESKKTISVKRNTTSSCGQPDEIA